MIDFATRMTASITACMVWRASQGDAIAMAWYDAQHEHIMRLIKAVKPGMFANIDPGSVDLLHEVPPVLTGIPKPNPLAERN